MPPERRLSNITPLPRLAFLLLSLEGVSEEEVGYILGTDVARRNGGWSMPPDARSRPRSPPTC